MEPGSQLKTPDLCNLPKGRMEIAIGICDSPKYFLLVNNSVPIIERYTMEIFGNHDAMISRNAEDFLVDDKTLVCHGSARH